MRTFHIGGAVQQTFKEPQVLSKHDGIIRHVNLRTVKDEEGKHIVLNKGGHVLIEDSKGRELERYSMEIGASLNFQDKAKIKKKDVLVTWDPYNLSIHADKGGFVEYRDIIEGVTMRKEVDETGTTKHIHTVIMEHKEDLHPQIVMYNKRGGEPIAYYSMPAGAHIVAKDKKTLKSGALLAKTPRQLSKAKDIVGGLPRVAELFEARKPKDAAEIAKLNGYVEFGETVKGKRQVIVRDEKSGMAEEHMIPINKYMTVFPGDYVRKGEKLTEGPIIPQEILEVCGPRELQEYLVNEIQEVYRLQGVEINDKHIEIIIRQMLRKVRILDPGDTEFLYGEQVEKHRFAAENRRVAEDGKRPAEAAPLFLGITKASLGTESFISAASFQDTTRVLTDAAATGRADVLHGFKENVIMGHVIPAGTGFGKYRNVKMKKTVDLFKDEEPEEGSLESEVESNV
jgi:DNA-directed RNA polymerase subunit beta'